jgi:hypothetical protein
MTKFAMETSDIPTTQERSHVKITNEDGACHGSLSIHSTRPNSQPSLLCGNIEAVT